LAKNGAQAIGATLRLESGGKAMGEPQTVFSLSLSSSTTNTKESNGYSD
jgi:hypothetical protein